MAWHQISSVQTHTTLPCNISSADQGHCVSEPTKTHWNGNLSTTVSYSIMHFTADVPAPQITQLYKEVVF